MSEAKPRFKLTRPTTPRGKITNTLHNDNDGQSRLGLAEMDKPTRNSKRWHRLTEEEINTMMGRLMLAAV